MIPIIEGGVSMEEMEEFIMLLKDHKKQLLVLFLVAFVISLVTTAIIYDHIWDEVLRIHNKI